MQLVPSIESDLCQSFSTRIPTTSDLLPFCWQIQKIFFDFLGGGVEEVQDKIEKYRVCDPCGYWCHPPLENLGIVLLFSILEYFQKY